MYTVGLYTIVEVIVRGLQKGLHGFAQQSTELCHYSSMTPWTQPRHLQENMPLQNTHWAGTIFTFV